MKKLIVIAILAVGGYFAWQQLSKEEPLESLYEEPYVIVYGRETCGWTQKYLQDLEAEGLDVFFESVDRKDVCDELHSRMEAAGLDTRRYNLPVIDVNATMLIRPDQDVILSEYQNYE